MRRQNIIGLYFVLSAVNGIIPMGIAMIFSVPILGIFSIWALTTIVTFGLICLVCLRSAIGETNLKAKTKRLQGKIERAYF